jgi:hypothetical protein
MMGSLLQLATNPNHQDWKILFAYLRLTRKYPASAFDLLKFFAACPQALVAATLRVEIADFDLLWRLTDQLSFSWYLLPTTDWYLAISRHFLCLRDALAAIKQGEQITWDEFQKFKELISIQQPGFRPLCDWLSPALFPDCQIETSALITMARKNPLGIFGRDNSLIIRYEQQLQLRHGTEAHYPLGPLVMEIQGQDGFPGNFRFIEYSRPYRPVLCAPFVAAHIALTKMDYNEQLTFELRVLRDFDKEWFDLAYALGLCFGLARETPSLPKVCK